MSPFEEVYVLILSYIILDVMKCIIFWSPYQSLYSTRQKSILVRNETNDKCHLWVTDRGSTETDDVLYYPRFSASEVWDRYCSSRISLLSWTIDGRRQELKLMFILRWSYSTSTGYEWVVTATRAYRQDTCQESRNFRQCSYRPLLRRITHLEFVHLVRLHCGSSWIFDEWYEL